MFCNDFHSNVVQSQIGCLSAIKSVLCVELIFFFFTSKLEIHTPFLVMIKIETSPLLNCVFQQLVIENAREKILSNKSLQEKLAENINKILGR